MSSGQQPCYEFGEFHLDPEARMLIRKGEPVSLSPKAFDLLLLLVHNRGRVVPKGELLQALWPDAFVEEENLGQNVFLVRKALGEKPQEHRYVSTVHGKGYRFDAPIKEVHGAMGDQTGVRGRSSRLGNRSALWGKGAVAGGLIVALAMAGLLFYSYHLRIAPQMTATGSHTHESAMVAPHRRAVAVLGFRNLSGRPDDAWLSTGLSEMLGTELAAGEQLRLVPAEDVTYSHGSPLARTDTFSQGTLVAMSQNLAADLLVFGSYATVGPKWHRRIRIDVRVQNVAGGNNFVEVAQAGTEDDLFDLVSQAGARLRERLALREISPIEAAAVKASLPSNREAMRLYAEGIAESRAFDSLLARELLQRAIAVDPHYPLAHSALSVALENLGYDEKAKQEAKTALQLSGSLSRIDRLSAQARVHETEKNWDRAIETYRALFNFAPDNLDYGLQLAKVEISAGKSKDALVVIEGLRRLPALVGDDPRIDLVEASAAERLSDLRREQAAAARAVQKASALGARLILARARNLEGLAISDLGDNQKARVDFEEARRIYAEIGDRAGVCQTLINIAGLEKTGRAEPMLQQALQIAREIGDQKHIAQSLLDLANVSYDKGKLLRAKANYAAALRTYQGIADRGGIAGALLNIGVALMDLGDYAAAEANQRQSLAITQETGSRFGEVAVDNNLGEIFYREGRLAEAMNSYDKSLSTAHETGLKDAYGFDLSEIGEVLRAQGNLEAARKKQEEAISGGDPDFDAKLALARIDLDQNLAADAEAICRKLVTETGEVRNSRILARYTILAQALLSQGKLADAELILSHAKALGMETSEFLEARLDFAINVARVQAAAGQRLAAIRKLHSTIAEARKFGNIPYELEARLALGEVEAEFGNSSVARSSLDAVQDDANARGFALIARKAATVRAPRMVTNPQGEPGEPSLVDRPNATVIHF